MLASGRICRSSPLAEGFETTMVREPTFHSDEPPDPDDPSKRVNGESWSIDDELHDEELRPQRL
ncbi:MAG TPA: hypothetical protein VLA12_02750, partial [Planctomycetaceae bacterium]|nr:hypothetical protein [Planctomycetaceae bacterium]